MHCQLKRRLARAKREAGTYNALTIRAPAAFLARERFVQDVT